MLGALVKVSCSLSLQRLGVRSYVHLLDQVLSFISLPHSSFPQAFLFPGTPSSAFCALLHSALLCSAIRLTSSRSILYRKFCDTPMIESDETFNFILGVDNSRLVSLAGGERSVILQVDDELGRCWRGEGNCNISVKNKGSLHVDMGPYTQVSMYTSLPQPPPISHDDLGHRVRRWNALRLVLHPDRHRLREVGPILRGFLLPNHLLFNPLLFLGKFPLEIRLHDSMRSSSSSSLSLTPGALTATTSAPMCTAPSTSSTSAILLSPGK